MGLKKAHHNLIERYEMEQRFDVTVAETVFREVPGRTLFARIYQPSGAGPFPVLLDLHGGAWTFKDRMANAPMAEAMAARGILTVSVDLRLGAEAPYPASVQDANYAVRWLKAMAPQWRGDPQTLGVLGSSSGGHVAQLLAMRPFDATYNAIELTDAPGLDASVVYVATRSPISDPLARYEHAVARGRVEMAERHHVYFAPFDSIRSGNPQLILERGEAQRLPPMLIMQGGLDDNVLPDFQRRFAQCYIEAGGECQLEIFKGCGHTWIAEPGPDTERAHALLGRFIVAQLSRLRLARPPV